MVNNHHVDSEVVFGLRLTGGATDGWTSNVNIIQEQASELDTNHDQPTILKLLNFC